MTQPDDKPRALLAAALAAAERGWPVFPLRPGGKPPALHGEARCPRTGICARGHVKWQERATTDPARITACWQAAPFNVGVATGPAGLVVIDLDVTKDESDAPAGAATFQALCERTGQPVPATFTLRTASGGEHRYFTAPDGLRLSNTAGKLGENIDTRAWGGYVVAAGSIVHGRAYALTDDREPAPLPGWLAALLRQDTRPAAAPPAPVVRSASRAALAALEREQRVVVAASEGERNHALNLSAFKLGRFIAWGDLTRDAVEEAFQWAGESAGLTAAECRATIRSALDASLRKARPREAL
ncbi:bifunctional DNA primase/polymerase [Streptomyces sp. NBC_01808]|uniref:bifunctional DNA primase/polymerase n=1 Tax=Streptomyces sp. NBC_01808 TaxID=2975947 RepID=UPI002DD846AB|nr:bifunctional DNA primase/polymerase [Streptomyces sp. NBC_01808]WSA41472.1 bifunctional DNA primase/polymerase [Streptomyces sp. NBC_01808]